MTVPHRHTDRYIRHTMFAPLGPEGQRRIAASTALVVGVGALGSVAADRLARAGVGGLGLVDPDHVQPSNLPRQLFYDETDAALGRRKVDAAALRLRAIRGDLRLACHPVAFDSANAAGLLAGVDIVVDGLDTFASRFVLNAACVHAGVPFVYGGVLGVTGMVMTVLPGQTACLQCLLPELPPEDAPGPATEGVLGTAPLVVAGLQVTAAIKLIAGFAPTAGLFHVDLWEGVWGHVPVARQARCPACGTCH